MINKESANGCRPSDKKILDPPLLRMTLNDTDKRLFHMMKMITVTMTMTCLRTQWQRNASNGRWPRHVVSLRDAQYLKNTAVLKVAVLYTASMLNTAIYRPAALTGSTHDDHTKHRGIPVSRYLRDGILSSGISWYRASLVARRLDLDGGGRLVPARTAGGRRAPAVTEEDEGRQQRHDGAASRHVVAPVEQCHAAHHRSRRRRHGNVVSISNRHLHDERSALCVRHHSIDDHWRQHAKNYTPQHHHYI